jgi:hypothetical protein
VNVGPNSSPSDAQSFSLSRVVEEPSPIALGHDLNVVSESELLVEALNLRIGHQHAPTSLRVSASRQVCFGDTLRLGAEVRNWPGRASRTNAFRKYVVDRRPRHRAQPNHERVRQEARRAARGRWLLLALNNKSTNRSAPPQASAIKVAGRPAPCPTAQTARVLCYRSKESVQIAEPSWARTLAGRRHMNQLVRFQRVVRPQSQLTRLLQFHSMQAFLGWLQLLQGRDLGARNSLRSLSRSCFSCRFAVSC